MRIKVEKPSAETIAEMKRCPTWSKEVSVFDWKYDATMSHQSRATRPRPEAWAAQPPGERL